MVMQQQQTKNPLVEIIHVNHFISRLFKELAPCTVATEVSPHVAAHYGYREVLHVLQETKGLPKSSIIANAAAIRGHLDIIRDLRELGIHCTERGADIAASEGHHQIIRDLREHGIHCTSEGALWASANNHVEIVKDLLEHKVPFDSAVADRAAKHGHTEIVKLLRSHDIRCTHWGARHTVGRGDFDFLLYLEADGVPLTDEQTTETLADIAAYNGRMQILRYLYETKGIKCTPRGISHTVCYGLLNILEYLAEQGADFTDRGEGNYCTHADWAAKNDLIDMLHFLRGHGDKCSIEGLQSAADKGFHRIVDDILTHQPELFRYVDIDEVFESKAYRADGRRDVIELLRAVGR